MANPQTDLARALQTRAKSLSEVVPYERGRDRALRLDFSVGNEELFDSDWADMARLAAYADRKVAEAGARYGAGGYGERRFFYQRSPLFGSERSLHLGVDVWAPAGTPVFAALDGTVHSFADNDNFGDYGPTVILRHEVEGVAFHALYGHLDRLALVGMEKGAPVEAGQTVGRFGAYEENGHWPPHLHFQLMFDMEGRQGDFPGVVSPTEADAYLANCPDPNLLLRFEALD